MIVLNPKVQGNERQLTDLFKGGTMNKELIPQEIQTLDLHHLTPLSLTKYLIYKVNERIQPGDDFFDEIYLEMEDVYAVYEVPIKKRISFKAISMLATKIKKEEKKLTQVSFVRNLERFVTNEDPWEELVKLYFGHLNQQDIDLIKHWMQSVLLTMTGVKERSHQYMWNILGKQGDGKSRMVKRLIQPFLDIDCALFEQDASVFGDANQYESVLTYNIVHIEELAGLDGKDTRGVKRLMTGEKASYRGFHTQKNKHAEINAMFIGTSNISIFDSVKDATGGRRFFETAHMDVSDYTHEDIELLRKDRDTAWIKNNLAVRLWASIDLTEPNSYFRPNETYFNKHVADRRFKDPITRCFEFYNILPGNITVNAADLRQIYNYYVKYEIVGHREYGAKEFNKEVTKLGFTLWPDSSTGRVLTKANKLLIDQITRINEITGGNL